MELTYLGHAAFLVRMGDKTLLFDPWVSGNPNTAMTLDELKGKGVDLVFVSHGHHDHGFEDAVELTRSTQAKAVGVFELVNALSGEGGEGIGGNIGGRFTVDGVQVYLATATHSCPYSAPCGFVVRYAGETLYHAGDTGLTSDMAILGKLFDIDVALLPAGGHFTLGIDEFPLAKEMLKAKHCIAMHHGTFPAIETEMEKLKGLADVLEPGQTEGY